jgi:LuxR family transcriptional regulator, maltose regulon positive regulatory protein
VARPEQPKVVPPPLLEMKLYVPQPQGGVVPRPRLDQRLDRGTVARVVLVSAPAGFGKTTLVAQWLARWLAAGPAAPSGARSGAWLSLDREDNDPATFWTYVIAALRTVLPEVGASALSLLQAPQAPPVPTVLTTLLNDLAATSRDVVLVLDDYHLVDSQDVHEGMAFLLEHLPPRLHLVIAGRADPPLPLARLRAGGRLVEVRAADLRFTADEAVAYLNGTMGLQLTAPDVSALEARTEGWIAALQLAALSMQGRDDVAGFISGFTGDDRYVVDYLVEEVLQRQPDRVQTFLLQTSVLDRLCGPLCDAVTGRRDGKAVLAELDRGNLFLVPLDDRRHWYRYHRLFADVLNARLLDEQPEQVPELHRRASSWYEQNGAPSEAVGHALAAEDFARAADLVELAMPTLRRQRQEATALSWLRALPDTVLRSRPVLSVHYAGTLLINGHLDGVEERLQDAERCMGPVTGAPAGSAAPPTGIVVVDDDEFRTLPSMIASYRAAQALAVGDLAGTITQATLALELADDDAYLARGAPAGLLGLAYWTTGELEAGHRMYTECTASLERAGFIADTLGCAIALADIRIAQGRLRDAMRTYQNALRRASRDGGPLLRGTIDMHIGLSELHRERGDVAGATQLLASCQELGEHLGLPQSRYRWRVAMARVRESHGDLEGALALLEDAERVYVGDFFPDVRPIPALKARVQIRQGNVGAALAWAHEHGLSVDGDLSYLREFEHVTLARALLARSGEDSPGPAADQATGLLQRLLVSAEAGGRNGTVIEILVQQALAQQMRGDVAAALTHLGKALELAEPEDYVRVFVDEGPPMAALLAAGAAGASTPGYARRLMAAFSAPTDVATTDIAPTDIAPTDVAPARQPLVEPLSERELEVLRLLRTDLDGPDIARELVVSLHTIRSHTKKIYAKLGVSSRRQAIRRAEELELLPRARSQGSAQP